MALDFMENDSLEFKLKFLKSGTELIDDDLDDDAQEEELTIDGIYERVKEPENQTEMIQNLETLFNTECSLKVAERYILKKVAQIEHKFENFDEVYKRVTDLNPIQNDALTFQFVRTGIQNIYRGVLNVLLEDETAFSIQLPCMNSMSHFGYNEDGVMIPLEVRGYLSIDNISTLLTYITMYFIFYEALLDLAASTTPNPQRLRSILYLVKSMADTSRVNDTTFYQTIQRVYSALQIKGDSALISYVDREINYSIGGDLVIENTYSALQQSINCLGSSKQLKKIESFNMASQAQKYS